MSPISMNHAAGSTLALADASQATEAAGNVDLNAVAHPATAAGTAPHATPADSLASLVPAGGLHPVVHGETGTTTTEKTAVSKKVWEYIHKNNLQDKLKL